MIAIVACCHGAKLYAHAARDFRSQQYIWGSHKTTNQNHSPHPFQHSDDVLGVVERPDILPALPIHDRHRLQTHTLHAALRRQQEAMVEVVVQFVPGVKIAAVTRLGWWEPDPAAQSPTNKRLLFGDGAKALLQHFRSQLVNHAKRLPSESLCNQAEVLLSCLSLKVGDAIFVRYIPNTPMFLHSLRSAYDLCARHPFKT